MSALSPNGRQSDISLLCEHIPVHIRFGARITKPRKAWIDILTMGLRIRADFFVGFFGNMKCFFYFCESIKASCTFCAEEDKL